MIKTTKKLAMVSAVALMFAGSAHAINFDDLAATQTDNFAAVTTGLNTLLGTATPDVTALSGAINTAVVNGAIDISGTNVALSSMAANVSATATAVGTSASSEAFAIAGAKLSTTVIGAMNSATVDVATRILDQTESTAAKLGVGSLAASGGTALDLGTPSVTPATGGIGAVLGVGGVLSSTGDIQLNLSGLTSETTNSVTNKLTDLQAMNVFNTAINVANLDAGIKVAAAVDPNAWFLNPQTGVVNLSNIAMTTTAIGAMNSSITRLGANLAK